MHDVSNIDIMHSYLAKICDVPVLANNTLADFVMNERNEGDRFQLQCKPGFAIISFSNNTYFYERGNDTLEVSRN